MRADENLILAGFMGTGKSVVGQELARRLGREFADTDSLIEAREGLTVAEIFSRQGEAHFRQVEAALCRELAARSGLVIATGGGMLVPPANYELLSASGPVVCLTASADEIATRLGDASDRPLLDGADPRARIVALLEERRDIYRQIPLHVDTTGLTVGQVAGQILAEAGTLRSQTIPVRYPGGEYSIHLGRGLLVRVGSLLRGAGLSGRVMLITNPTVGRLYGASVVEGLTMAGFAVSSSQVQDGEAYKTLDSVRGLYDSFVQAGLDRQASVLALGGGVVGDMAGFAAATYLRGVPFVQLPTTLLSMVDASIGGKVGVDLPSGKNLVGAFKQPALVIVDPDVLDTLPPGERAGGVAEVVKAGLIHDSRLFEQIEAFGPAPIMWLIERAIRVKVEVVEADPYETGRRAVLNLGHTFAHALELASSYALSHGQAVAIGLAAAAHLSARLGWCDSGLPARVESLLARLSLPTRYRGYTPEQLWEAMATDKKRQGLAVRFVLIKSAGDVFVTDQVRREDVLIVLETLREG